MSSFQWVFPGQGQETPPYIATGGFGPISKNDQIVLEFSPSSYSGVINLYCGWENGAEGHVWNIYYNKGSPFTYTFNESTPNSGDTNDRHICHFFPPGDGSPGGSGGNSQTFQYLNDPSNDRLLWSQDGSSTINSSPTQTSTPTTISDTPSSGSSGDSSTSPSTDQTTTASTAKTTSSPSQSPGSSPNQSRSSSNQPSSTSAGESIASLSTQSAPSSATQSSTDNAIQSPQTSTVGESGGLSDSAKIGIGVGVGVGGALLLAVIAYMLYRLRKQREEHKKAMSEVRGWEPGVLMQS